MTKLKFTKFANVDYNVNGTCLQGYVNTSFNKLQEVFGMPTSHVAPSEMEKVTIEWVLKFEDGTIATIYDWKGYGYQPTGDEMYEWHIGGRSNEAMYLVKEALGL